MHDGRKSGWAGVLVSMAGLLFLYVGAYAILVRPQRVAHYGWSVYYDGPIPPYPRETIEPFYLRDQLPAWPTWHLRRHGSFRKFFAPVHWVDRRIRKATWEMPKVATVIWDEANGEYVVIRVD